MLKHLEAGPPDAAALHETLSIVLRQFQLLMMLPADLLMLPTRL